MNNCNDDLTTVYQVSKKTKVRRMNNCNNDFPKLQFIVSNAIFVGCLTLHVSYVSNLLRISILWILYKQRDYVKNFCMHR